MLRSLHTTVSCIALAFAVSYVAIASDYTNTAVTVPAAQTKSAVSDRADGKVEQQKQDQTAQKRQQITATSRPRMAGNVSGIRFFASPLLNFQSMGLMPVASTLTSISPAFAVGSGADSYFS